MMEGLISFMTDTSENKGIGYIETSNDDKIRFANESLEWNKTNSEFVEIFGNDIIKN